MYHRIKHRKLNRTSTHRKRLLENMATALLTHEQIYTTLPKAKNLRPYVEKLITKARDDTLKTRRYLLNKLNNDNVIVTKLLTTINERFKGRPGGYLRIVKAGFRYGDNADMAYIQLV